MMLPEKILMLKTQGWNLPEWDGDTRIRRHIAHRNERFGP